MHNSYHFAILFDVLDLLSGSPLMLEGRFRTGASLLLAQLSYPALFRRLASPPRVHPYDQKAIFLISQVCLSPCSRCGVARLALQASLWLAPLTLRATSGLKDIGPWTPVVGTFVSLM